MCRIISKLRHIVDINILKTVYYALAFGKVDLDPVYKDLNILRLPEKHFHEKAKLMHKYHNGMLTEIFKDHFESNATVSHSYNLRRVRLQQPILSCYAKKIIKHNGVDIWNTVPDKIKTMSNIKTFSFNLKKDILLV